LDVPGTDDRSRHATKDAREDADPQEVRRGRNAAGARRKKTREPHRSALEGVFVRSLLLDSLSLSRGRLSSSSTAPPAVCVRDSNRGPGATGGPCEPASAVTSHQCRAGMCRGRGHHSGGWRGVEGEGGGRPSRCSVRERE